MSPEFVTIRVLGTTHLVTERRSFSVFAKESENADKPQKWTVETACGMTLEDVHEYQFGKLTPTTALDWRCQEVHPELTTPMGEIHA